MEIIPIEFVRLFLVWVIHNKAGRFVCVFINGREYGPIRAADCGQWSTLCFGLNCPISEDGSTVNMVQLLSVLVDRKHCRDGVRSSST